MECDYNRISSRYVRIFADLDSECYKRIYALDKQSFTLSEKVQKQLLSEFSSNTAALNLLGIEEVSSSKTLMFVSSLNRRALEVLRTLHDYISQESRINSLVNSLLVNEEIVEKISLYIPVVWTESDTLEGNTVKHESCVTNYIDQQSERLIVEKAEAFCSGASLSAWSAFEEPEKEVLNKEFNALAESCFTDAQGETDQRVYKTMLSLWQNSELVSLKRSL